MLLRAFGSLFAWRLSVQNESVSCLRHDKPADRAVRKDGLGRQEWCLAISVQMEWLSSLGRDISISLTCRWSSFVNFLFVTDTLALMPALFTLISIDAVVSRKRLWSQFSACYFWNMSCRTKRQAAIFVTQTNLNWSCWESWFTWPELSADHTDSRLPTHSCIVFSLALRPQTENHHLMSWCWKLKRNSAKLHQHPNSIARIPDFYRPRCDKHNPTVFFTVLSLRKGFHWTRTQNYSFIVNTSYCQGGNKMNLKKKTLKSLRVNFTERKKDVCRQSTKSLTSEWKLHFEKSMQLAQWGLFPVWQEVSFLADHAWISFLMN